jgi:hypothetical protein
MKKSTTKKYNEFLNDHNELTKKYNEKVQRIFKRSQRIGDKDDHDEIPNRQSPKYFKLEWSLISNSL